MLCSALSFEEICRLRFVLTTTLSRTLIAPSPPQATMTVILGVFAITHSGLAGLRPKGETLIGERAYRVIFALTSLSLSVVAIVYFINHRYSGTPLWDVRGTPALHELLWATNFVSFLFLYPSTFNILEVAAIDKPKVRRKKESANRWDAATDAASLM